MVPDNLRDALAAVTLGSLVALSGVGIGGAVAVQQPSGDVPAPQPTHTPTENSDETNDSSAPTGDEVVERFEERIESLESVVMAYETNTTIDGNTTMTSERRMWVDYENDRVRTEWETNRTHVITVRNGSGMVSYDVENNQVNRFNLSVDMTHVTPVDTLVTETQITYDFSESDRYEPIDVGNHTGYYTEYEYDGNTTSVVVAPCEDTTYRVSGDRSKNETVGVADSVICE